MPINKLHTPYRERILAYCQKHEIEVPRHFDVTKSSESLALIDETTRPHKLVKRTTHQKKEVIEFLNRDENLGKKFKILDFKRCCEWVRAEDGKLVRGEQFDCKGPNELLYLVT